MAEPVVQQTEAVTTAATSQSESSSKFIQTALRFAELSKLAYHDYPVVLERLPEYYHLQAEMEICDKHTDTQGFIASDSSSVVVAFRGTDAFIDILLGLKFVPVPIGPGLAYAHEGYVNAVNAVYTSTVEKLKPHLGQKQLFITGHSLGAALASLLAYRLSLDYPTCQPHLYAFGCPPVGDENFSKFFQGRPSSIVTIDGDPLSTGLILTLGEKVGLYKPVEVKYIPGGHDHLVGNYVEELEKLLK